MIINNGNSIRSAIENADDNVGNRTSDEIKRQDYLMLDQDTPLYNYTGFDILIERDGSIIELKSFAAHPKYAPQVIWRSGKTKPLVSECSPVTVGNLTVVRGGMLVSKEVALVSHFLGLKHGFYYVDRPKWVDGKRVYDKIYSLV